MYTREASKLMEKWSTKTTYHKVKTFNKQMGIYEVETGLYITEHKKKGGHLHMVGIISRTCTCKKWQIFKLPCSHTFATMQYIRMDPDCMIERWCQNEN